MRIIFIIGAKINIFILFIICRISSEGLEEDASMKQCAEVEREGSKGIVF